MPEQRRNKRRPNIMSVVATIAVAIILIALTINTVVVYKSPAVGVDNSAMRFVGSLFVGLVNATPLIFIIIIGVLIASQIDVWRRKGE